jgi:hypothetical protein
MPCCFVSLKEYILLSSWQIFNAAHKIYMHPAEWMFLKATLWWIPLSGGAIQQDISPECPTSTRK